MPWCALLTAVKNYNKSLEKLQDFFFKSKTKTKTNTFIFVLEAPRDQDPDLGDYITGNYAILWLPMRSATHFYPGSMRSALRIKSWHKLK